MKLLLVVAGHGSAAPPYRMKSELLSVAGALFRMHLSPPFTLPAAAAPPAPSEHTMQRVPYCNWHCSVLVMPYYIFPLTNF